MTGCISHPATRSTFVIDQIYMCHWPGVYHTQQQDLHLSLTDLYVPNWKHLQIYMCHWPGVFHTQQTDLHVSLTKSTYVIDRVYITPSKEIYLCHWPTYIPIVSTYKSTCVIDKVNSINSTILTEICSLRLKFWYLIHNNAILTTNLQLLFSFPTSLKFTNSLSIQFVHPSKVNPETATEIESKMLMIIKPFHDGLQIIHMSYFQPSVH